MFYRIHVETHTNTHTTQSKTLEGDAPPLGARPGLGLGHDVEVGPGLVDAAEVGDHRQLLRHRNIAHVNSVQQRRDALEEEERVRRAGRRRRKQARMARLARVTKSNNNQIEQERRRKRR